MPTAWQPDAHLLEGLAPATAVDGYEVRPPKGYALAPTPPNAPAGVKGFAWAGPMREDRTAPQFMVLVTTPPPGEADRVTLEQFLDIMLAGVKRRRANWTQTPTAQGRVNGLPFVRAYWSGEEAQSRLKMRGFLYATRDGSKFIQLSSQDVEPHHEEALKLAEAAALTFKKK